MDKVTGQCPQTTTFLKRKESRSGYRTEVRPLTNLTPYRQAKPAHRMLSVTNTYIYLAIDLQSSMCSSPILSVPCSVILTCVFHCVSVWFTCVYKVDVQRNFGKSRFLSNAQLLIYIYIYIDPLIVRCPSLISLMVSVDVKHHVYLLTVRFH